MDDNFDFTVTEIHTAFDFKWDYEFSFDGEMHPFWELVFVKNGEVSVTEDDRVYNMCSGQLIFHAPMEFHRIRVPQGKSANVLVVTFYSTGNLPDILSKGIFNISTDCADVLCRVFNYCREVYEKTAKPYSNVAARCGIASLCCHIAQNYEPSNDHEDMKNQNYYHNIVRIMKEGVEDALTLPQIAKKAAVSVSTVKVVFSEFTGMGPKSYYNSLRTKKAAELLCKGMSAKEVAERMNFSSPNYFCDFFKKQYGEQPGAYKKNHGRR